jgi:RNA polymerase sigma factor (sigma-70 family)
MDDAELRAQLEQCHPLSYGWALSCCGHDRTEAADVLQTVYLKVLQGGARFDGRAAFKTWLFAVIRNTAAAERRHHWLRRLKWAASSPTAADLQPAPQTAGIERAERRQAIESALARLPRRQQEVLHLVFYQDLSLTEAAAAMGLGIGSARTHYARGKRRLRELLKPEEHANAI